MQIATGSYHTCALSTANKVKCFGDNMFGQIIPMQIVAGANKVKCWGYNVDGQLGYGDTNNRGDEANEMGDILLEIDLGTNFIPMQIVAGAHHTCALSTGNKVKCWGYNVDGQLGYGD
eukprot:201346_1